MTKTAQALVELIVSFALCTYCVMRLCRMPARKLVLDRALFTSHAGCRWMASRAWWRSGSRASGLPSEASSAARAPSQAQRLRPQQQSGPPSMRLGCPRPQPAACAWSGWMKLLQPGGLWFLPSGLKLEGSRLHLGHLPFAGSMRVSVLDGPDAIISPAFLSTFIKQAQAIFLALK